jgi:predicted GNAT superfamily acetyltransferase
LTIRPFDSLEDYLTCTDFQEEIWGRGFSEKVSAAILMIANRLGGLSAGAFDESGELQGFVFGLTGMIEGRLVHWSDMLGVRDTGRDRGLGTRLKKYQREVVLGRGINEMRWTFDPLQSRNANVNFSKLGIICREYVENMYGQTDSPLHRGIGTDRMVALWELDSERVKARLVAGGGPANAEVYSRAPQLLGFQEGGLFPVPGEPKLALDDPHLLVNIPAAIEPIMDQDMALAVRWREATRELFVHYLGRGYEIREFLRGEELSSYVLVKSELEGSRA